MTALPAVAAEALDGLLAADPVAATYLGDHRHDGRLPDPSPEGAERRAGQLRAQLAALDALEPGPAEDAVDAAVLRTALAAELFDLEDVSEAEWNPMLHNPGDGVHALLSRGFAPLGERLDAVRYRLDQVPGYLAAARRRLRAMSPVHVETALGQLTGTLGLLDTELPAVAGAARDPAALAAAAERARSALVEHRAWLAEQAGPGRDARLGAEQFAAKLALTLDTAFDPQELLARAEAELADEGRLIAEDAARYVGGRPEPATVRAALDRLAADVPDDASILDHCRAALARTEQFVRERELVTVHDDPVTVVEMPEIDRGVAVAYCRESGPLETVALPIEFAVAPTPAGWTPEQVASFYREYNLHMLHNLTVHEAMPGHALQQMHAVRHRAATPVRAVWGSGTFVEGWAAYTEELMAERGYPTRPADRAALEVRLQQRKMRLRTILNTILDIRFHCDDLDERAAMQLMTEDGFQEVGEAAGKWRRVQLSSTQLCTYFVGHAEVRGIVDDLRRQHPQWTDREVHDAVLAHGSPPPRHLRTLLGLG